MYQCTIDQYNTSIVNFFFFKLCFVFCHSLCLWLQLSFCVLSSPPHTFLLLLPASLVSLVCFRRVLPHSVSQDGCICLSPSCLLFLSSHLLLFLPCCVRLRFCLSSPFLCLDGSCLLSVLSWRVLSFVCLVLSRAWYIRETWYIREIKAGQTQEKTKNTTVVQRQRGKGKDNKSVIRQT